MKRVLTVWTLIVLASSVVLAQTRTPEQIGADLDAAAALLGKVAAEVRGLVQPPPAVTTVTTAAELKAALAKGGAIKLADGGVFVGNFVVSVDGTSLLGTGTLQPADGLTPTVRVTASDVTVIGPTVLGPNPDRETFAVGTTAATSVEQNPSNVRVDSVRLVANAGGGLRGFSLHGRNITVTHARVEGYWFKGRDNQAIWISNGPGPYTLTDNYLEAAGENILVGGDTVRIPGCVPSDILIRGNTLTKPLAWKTNGATVKNLLELKTGRRVLIENNLLENVWPSGQDGSAIQITVRNQYGDSPWAEINDVTLRGNTVRGMSAGWGINVLGHDNLNPPPKSVQMQTLTIEGNYFPDAPNFLRVGRGVATALVVRHNTFPAVTGVALNFNGVGADGITPLVLTPLTFTDNVGKGGAYGVSGDGGVGIGLPALQRFAPIQAWANNVLEKTAARTIKWPTGTLLVEPGALAAQLDTDGHFTGAPAGAGW